MYCLDRGGVQNSLSVLNRCPLQYDGELAGPPSPGSAAGGGGAGGGGAGVAEVEGLRPLPGGDRLGLRARKREAQ